MYSEHSYEWMVSKLNFPRTVKALEGATPHLTGIQVSVELDHMYNRKIENNALKYVSKLLQCRNCWRMQFSSNSSWSMSRAEPKPKVPIPQIGQRKFCSSKVQGKDNHELCDLGSGPSIYQRFSAHLTSVDLPDLQVISLTRMVAMIAWITPIASLTGLQYSEEKV